jgi:hypothetical protein
MTVPPGLLRMALEDVIRDGGSDPNLLLFRVQEILPGGHWVARDAAVSGLDAVTDLGHAAVGVQWGSGENRVYVSVSQLGRDHVNVNVSGPSPEFADRTAHRLVGALGLQPVRYLYAWLDEPAPTP